MDSCGAGGQVVTTADGNTTQTAYNSSTTTVTDQVGRKRQFQYDGLGNLVKVLEQDGTGALTLTTTYTYDILGDLIQVSEGGQILEIQIRQPEAQDL